MKILTVIGLACVAGALKIYRARKKKSEETLERESTSFFFQS